MPTPKPDTATLQDRIDKALNLIVCFGGIDGDHHKAWVIDQVARVLAANEYDELVRASKGGFRSAFQQEVKVTDQLLRDLNDERTRLDEAKRALIAQGESFANGLLEAFADDLDSMRLELSRERPNVPITRTAIIDLQDRIRAALVPAAAGGEGEQ